MKYILCFLTFAFGQITFGQTQSEMNQEAFNHYKEKDAELNLVYNKILKEYGNEKDFIINLKKAQNIWIQFRDAEMAMRFPKEDKLFHYGSVYPMCRSYILAEMTEERTNKLKVWLDGIEEGEVCLGTIKMKD
ncbi:lysozyme inhibitor LprI family protein [Flavobacterium sp.]|jgi:uncharacterized protein YecT (DUF1311 family)|uniref:lysozyme inhibitor LprI family protein n=1 Tax=Flavobacterium sp. TaxID=239 RepID=UPI002A8140F2|nr:lysozyme inhibitor LprI family protein [Flavobacterium sp.]